MCLQHGGGQGSKKRKVGVKGPGRHLEAGVCVYPRLKGGAEKGGGVYRGMVVTNGGGEG